MIYYEDGIYTVRNLEEKDIEEIVRGEIEQGWNASDEKYRMRLKHQREGRCIPLVAEYYNSVVGYVNVYFHASAGPFMEKGYPEIVDFGVLEKYRNHGIGSRLMDAAEKIRQSDQDVVIVFITNIASFAIRGYEVGALDYVVKPLTYYNFSMRLTRALKRSKARVPHELMLTLPDGVKKLEVGQIYYVEVQNRMLHYYTTEGIFHVRGTMQSAQQMLKAYSFAKCNYWYMVNLRHVTEVKKNTVVVGTYELEISRRNRTPFLKALTEYVGGYR